VVIAVSPEGAQQLAMQAAAVGFVVDAFSHLKVIGHTAGAEPLLHKSGVMPDRGTVAMQSGAADMFLAEAAKGRVWDREPKVRPVF